MTERTYLIRVLLIILLAAVMVLGLNFFADPYAITGSPRVSGVNEYKVDINDRVRLMKKYNPLQSEHNSLIVGNSRVEMGINPDHPCFEKAGFELYNLGVPGAIVRTQLSYALNVMHQQPIDTIFLSLDFTDFIFTRKHDRFSEPLLQGYAGDGFRYDASGNENANYALSYWLDFFKSLFSLDALISSVRTLVLQGDNTPDRTDAGFNPARDFAEIVRVEGASALFERKIVDLREHFTFRWYLRGVDGRIDPSFNNLEWFLDKAAEQGIRVYLFINPFHETYWDVLRERGRTHHIELNDEWLAEIKALVKKYPADTVTLWDFSEDSPFIHEQVPASGVKSGPLQWFWEPSHYRAELGDLMIETMLSETCGTEEVFGSRLH